MQILRRRRFPGPGAANLGGVRNDFARRIISDSSTIIIASFFGAVILFGLTAGLAEQSGSLS